MENLIPTKTIKENGVVAIKNGIKPNPNKLIPIERKPTWLRIKSLNSPKYRELKTIVSEKKLHTVCEEAMCPNIQECWSHGTATFMLLGSVCTRACKFCAVDTGNPKGLLDKEEPLKVANSISHMDLKYAVLTSVNRDDLSDGGANHFSETVKAIKRPIVIITSNNEKELPEAFLRRCFFHYIQFPDKDTLEKIVNVHYPNIKKLLLDNALNRFFEIRETPGLKKKPSTSEALDWIKLLLIEDINPIDLKSDGKDILPKLHGALIKNEQDIHLFERLAFIARGNR